MANKDIPQFRGLPWELRDKIWKLALPDPRIVWATSHNDPSTGHSVLRSSPPSNMTLRKLCRESAKIFLKSYVFRFMAAHWIWIDCERDTLYFDDDWLNTLGKLWCNHYEYTINPSQIVNIKKVAWAYRKFREDDYTQHFGKWVKWVSDAFPNANEITVVYEAEPIVQKSYDWCSKDPGDQLVFVEPTMFDTAINQFRNREVDTEAPEHARHHLTTVPNYVDRQETRHHRNGCGYSNGDCSCVSYVVKHRMLVTAKQRDFYEL